MVAFLKLLRRPISQHSLSGSHQLRARAALLIRPVFSPRRAGGLLAPELSRRYDFECAGGMPAAKYQLTLRCKGGPLLTYELELEKQVV
jgi:hypothetical protein